MAFPTNGVIDPFNRADAASLGANYTANPFNNGATSLRISSNAAIGQAATFAFDINWYNVATFGPNSEAGVTLTALGDAASETYLVVRIQSPSAGSSTGDGYWAERIGTGTIGIKRIDNGVGTLLGAAMTPGTLVAGDSLGFEARGSTLQVYRKNGGTWATWGTSRTDSTYTAAGYVALGSYEDTRGQILDDFFAGSVTFTGATATSIVVTPASSGTRTRLGVSATPIVVTPASAGTRTRFGATATAIVVTPASSARLGRFGVSASSIVVTPASAGVRTRFGVTATPIAVTVATAGIRSRTGASATTITVTETSAGTRTRFGATATPVVFTITTAIGATLGASASTFAFAITTAGTRTRLGATATSIIVTPASSGTRTRLGATSTSIVYTVASAGTRTRIGQSAAAVVVTFTTSGTRKAIGQSATPIVFGFTTTTASFLTVGPLRIVNAYLAAGPLTADLEAAVVRTPLAVGATRADLED